MDADQIECLSVGVEQLTVAHNIINRLKGDGIIYIGDLVQKTDKDLLYIQGFGRKSLTKVKLALVKLRLELGMTVPDWP